MGRTGIAIVLCCGLVPVAACTRTSDGTVVMKRPPSISALLPPWMRRDTRAIAQPPTAADSAAPPTGPPARRTTRPSLLQGASRSLACRDVTEAGGPVRIVCR